MTAIDNVVVRHQVQDPSEKARGSSAGESTREPALVAIFLAVVLCVLAAGPLVLGPWASTQGNLNLGNLLYSALALGLLSAAYMVWRGGPWSAWGLLSVSPRALVLGLGLGVVLMPAASLLALWVRAGLGLEPDNPQAEALNVEGLSWAGRALMTILVVFLAPLGEELLFRGIVFRAFFNDRRPMDAVWVSTVLFSLMHGELSIVVATFLLGWVMGVLRLRTGSLWPALALHVGNNSLAWCALLLGWDI